MRKTDKHDQQIPANIEQLIDYYNLENLWPTINSIFEKINKKEGE